MIKQASNLNQKTLRSTAQADVTVQELEQIYAQISRISDNCWAFRKLNSSIVKDACLDAGTVRLLQMLRADFEDAADILNGLV